MQLTPGDQAMTTRRATGNTKALNATRSNRTPS